jgi:hypothetical protein
MTPGDPGVSLPQMAEDPLLYPNIDDRGVFLPDVCTRHDFPSIAAKHNIDFHVVLSVV